MLRRLWGILVAFLKRASPTPQPSARTVSTRSINNQLVILAAQEGWPQWKLEAALRITAKEDSPYISEFREWDLAMNDHIKRNTSYGIQRTN